MRIRLVWPLLTVSIVALSFRATAAPINIVVSLIPGTTNWTMSLNVDPGYTVGSLDFVTSPPITALVVNAANPTVSPPDSVFVLNLIGDGRGILSLNNPAFGVAMSGLLGTLVSTTTDPALIQLVEDQSILGPAVYDANFNELPPNLWTVRVVPEPQAAGLLALAGLASYFWRKATNPAKYAA